MDSSKFWTIVLFLSLGTLTIRSSFFFLYKYLTVSEKVKESFNFIPAAVLPAIFTPLVIFYTSQQDNSLFGKERILAFIIAVFFCYKTKSVIWGIVSGMISLYIIQFILGLI